MLARKIWVNHLTQLSKLLPEEGTGSLPHALWETKNIQVGVHIPTHVAFITHVDLISVLVFVCV